MKISGVYKIQSKLFPDRLYIGSAININKRWNAHLNELRNNKHRNQKLQNHFNKYKEEDLEFLILAGCDKDKLIETEQYFMDIYDPYFNIYKTARFNFYPPQSEETKRKRSESMKGKKSWNSGKRLINGKYIVIDAA